MNRRPLYEIRTSKDEMSEVRSLAISIPPYGPAPIEQAFEEFCKEAPPESLESIKEEFGYSSFANNPNRLSKRGSNDDQLSVEGFNHRVCCLIEELQRLTVHGPSKFDAQRLILISVALGKTVEHARLRQSHFANVRRGKKVRDGACLAGEMSRGRITNETQKILEIMRAEVETGATVMQAARKAQRQVPGKALDSYRKLFNRHKKK